MTAVALADVLMAAGNRSEAEPLLEEARDLYDRKGNVVAAGRIEQLLAAHHPA